MGWLVGRSVGVLVGARMGPSSPSGSEAARAARATALEMAGRTGAAGGSLFWRIRADVWAGVVRGAVLC